MTDSRDDFTRIPFTCTFDCGGRCALEAHVRDGRVVRVDTPPDQPDTVWRPRLVPCIRGRTQHRLRRVPERATRPLRRRTGPRDAGRFEPVSWDEALDEVAARLDETRRRHGLAAILHAVGAGSIAGRGISGAAASRRFFSYWGGVTETHGNLSNHCASVAAEWMLGGRVPGSDRATLLDSRLIILWGNNPAETRMGANTAHFIAEARERGARVILVDPRYTDTGVLVDQWIPIYPGTDAALVAALAYVLEVEGLVDRAFLEACTTGYPAYRRYLLGRDDGVPKTPAWAEAITGVPEDTIYQLARAYGTVKPAALLPGWGPQRTRYGEQSARAFIALACMSGNVGLRGGGLASLGTRANMVPVGALPSGPHAAARRISAVTWADELLGGRLDPPVRMAYVVAGNLINRSPNTPVNAQALAALDFVVVQDPFLTPTARCADLVLPICTDLERADLVTAWGHDAHLFYSRPAAAPLGEARTDYWVFARLAERLGLGEAYTRGRSAEAWVEHLLATTTPDPGTLRREGVLRQDGAPRVALEAFRADPAAHPLPTPSGRIELRNPQADDCGLPAVPAYVPDADGSMGAYPLRLITPHSKLRTHSVGHPNDWLQRLERHAVWIHPLDAEARGIVDEDLVEVVSAVGRVVLPAYVTPRVMPGVVSVYEGAWYRPDGAGVDRGGCANVLTRHRTSPTGGLATHSARVEVRRWV